ncbi:MAG: efflux transporter outer membrane subunit [Stellaceae bacterium]
MMICASQPGRFIWIRATLLGVGVITAGLLSSCDLGPDYKPPALQIPSSWSNTNAAAIWPALDWWHGFGSPQLDVDEAQAAKANYDLKAAVARVREANAQVEIAGAPLLPSIDLNGSAARERTLAAGSGSKLNITDFTVAPAAAYEVDFWGKNWATLASAQASANASRYDRQVVGLTVVTGVADTYFQVVALQDRLKVAEQNLANGESVLRGVEAQFRAGTATRLDVVQQQTVVSNLRAAIPPLQQQLAQNVDALAILLGKLPEDVKVTQSSLSALSIPKVAPGLPAALLARRPDVREAEAQLIAANANIKAARAQFFPDITLTAEGGVESTALSTLFTPAGAIYALAASVTQPIFEGGSLQGQLEYSKARYDELLQDYHKAVISAFGDVENALVVTQKTAEQQADEADTVAKARRAFEISQVQYRAGTITLLTVLNTETALFSAEDTLVQDRLAHMQATVSLFQALGGGWHDQSKTTQPHD